MTVFIPYSSGQQSCNRTPSHVLQMFKNWVDLVIDHKVSEPHLVIFSNSCALFHEFSKSKQLKLSRGNDLLKKMLKCIISYLEDW